MQGEVSYRESDSQSSFPSDLESGNGTLLPAAKTSSSAGKKTAIVTVIVLFIAAGIILVQLGNDRPFVQYDTASLNPVSPHPNAFYITYWNKFNVLYTEMYRNKNIISDKMMYDSVKSYIL